MLDVRFFLLLSHASRITSVNRFSGRHTGTGNIVFGDSHVAAFRYGYVVGLSGGNIADPKRPDINWEFDAR
jgi:prepilin-type processing-associated H-X9-DG protein